ncbi:uncharacterized protein LOC128920355 [Zeugodacus cucurbitae]|uniref:uncharacterized protein LOC128920355 n=1 Tax=Zeugodacus cucurbitae TaxID=28588 RepID=UPI0023D91187|nr:uncharacterized protein LOC128920355 [Zeugodacus cucurbitae]
MLLNKLLALSLLLTVLDLTSCQWCTRKIYERQSYTREKDYIETYITSKWIFFEQEKTRHASEVVTDYKNVSKSERICCDGYRLIGGNCEPICKPNCQINSRCTGVNECTCNDGYFSSQSTAVDTTESNIELCLPICSAGCPANSSCVRPNDCVCAIGYEMSAHGVCERTTITTTSMTIIETTEDTTTSEIETTTGISSTTEVTTIETTVDTTINDIETSGLSSTTEKTTIETTDDTTITDIKTITGLSSTTEISTIETTDDTTTSDIETTTSTSSTTEVTTIETTDDTKTSEIETTTITSSTIEMTTIETTDDTTTSDSETTSGISSTTESIELFTNTVEGKVLTEVSAGDEKGAFLPSNELNKCADQCSCWKVHPRDKCHVICGSTETRCLEPQFSRCIEPSKRIEYRVSDVTQIYTCYPDSFLGTPKTAGSTRPLQTIVVGLLLTAIMLVVFFFIHIVPER